MLAEETWGTEKTANFMSRLMKGFMPPDDLTVSQWAERNRKLTTETSAETGPWRNDKTPYLVDVMDSFNDPRVNHIVLVAASQVGKTEAELNMLAYLIDEDPSSVLYIFPTKEDAKSFSKERVAPMIRECPALRRKVADPLTRDSRNTIAQKSYPGGILTMVGSTEAHELCSRPERIIIGDERDRWAASAGKEGDPWKLALARQTTFYNSKAVEVSTPTIKGNSNIEKAYKTGTMERWKTECPHCGGYHEIEWENIRFDYEEQIIRSAKSYKVKSCWYVCPECGAISDERTMKKQPARWEADNPDAYDDGTRSFWLNAFVSRWSDWTETILKFLQSKDDPAELQVIFNTRFGKLWEYRGDLQTEDKMLERREQYEAELPEGVLVLTCGIDTQDNRLEYEVVGHGLFNETWGIEYGVIMGKPDEDATWEALDMVLDKIYRFKDGIGLRISMSFMDEGGHYTQEVRYGCQKREGKKLFCIKGMAGQDKPYVSPPKAMRIIIDECDYGSCFQYQLGVDAGKRHVFDCLNVQSPGAGYCHFPVSDTYGGVYFSRLLSERLEYQKDKKNPWAWVKIPGHERNEALDCRVYAVAAFRALPLNLDAVIQAIGAKRDQARKKNEPPKPEEFQKRKTPPTSGKRKGSRGLERDAW